MIKLINKNWTKKILSKMKKENKIIQILLKNVNLVFLTLRLIKCIKKISKK